MKTINLRDYYPFYQHDGLLEVPDEVANLYDDYKRTEQAYQRQKYRYKAHYSLDAGDGIEHDILFAEALQTLSEKKRNVILLSYFMEMSDAEIAREMNLVRSTIHEHRKRSLALLKNIMEGSTDEKEL